MKRRMSEYLEIDDSSGMQVIRCRKCGHAFCPPTENYKEDARVSESPLAKIRMVSTKTERFVLREFYCPSCATLLNVDMTLKGLPVLWDIQPQI